MANELTHPRWTEIWDKGLEPGELFDANSITPLLGNLIKDGKIPNGRSLVPGCGRGYDVTALATKDRYVLGLDIAENAVKAAKQRRDALSEEECASIANADFQTTSFFDLDGSTEKKFDFIYDYTFLCALDPSVRPQWAQKMAELVKPQGELLTLIFPIREPDDKGPPFQVSMELYRELLEPVGFTCELLELLPPELCHKGRRGDEAVDVKGNVKIMGTSAVGRWRRV